MALTKADVAQKVSEECGFLRWEAQEIVERLLETMKTSLVAGEDVMITGFGKWSVKHERARRGRNPKTGELMILDARRVVTWKYSLRLKIALNGS